MYERDAVYEFQVCRKEGWGEQVKKKKEKKKNHWSIIYQTKTDEGNVDILFSHTSYCVTQGLTSMCLCVFVY